MLTRETAHVLFNLLRELGEWSQCEVMHILIRYVPSNDDEVFDILVRGFSFVLGPRGSHANTWHGGVPADGCAERFGRALEAFQLGRRHGMRAALLASHFFSPRSEPFRPVQKRPLT